MSSSKFSTILLIDTSHPMVWVALVKDGDVVAEKEWTGDRALGVKLLEVIEEMTAGKKPDRIAVHKGPGHFMALRTGVVTAQSLALAQHSELVEISGEDRLDKVRQAQEAEPVEVVKVTYDQTPPAA